MNSEGEDSSNSDDNAGDSSGDEEVQDQSMARKKSLLFALSLPHEKNGDENHGKQKHTDFEIMGNPSNLEGNSKDSFSEYSAGSGAKNKNKILSRDAILSMVRASISYYDIVSSFSLVFSVLV